MSESEIKNEINKMCKSITDLREVVEKNHEEIKPILDGLKALTVGRKAILWVTSLIVAIGGAIFMIKKLF